MLKKHVRISRVDSRYDGTSCRVRVRFRRLELGLGLGLGLG